MIGEKSQEIYLTAAKCVNKTSRWPDKAEHWNSTSIAIYSAVPPLIIELGQLQVVFVYLQQSGKIHQMLLLLNSGT